MTLEDFFTLTEMNNGLTAPARVRELISIMQKERETTVNNIGDAMRHWSAVASTIAATENKDCLDLFIQLGGLRSIDHWLKDAQKFNNETRDSCSEESIMHFLQALEKLHIDSETSVSTGIWATVENLLGHSSSKVQERAGSLFDSWKKDKGSGSASHDVEKADAVAERTLVNPSLMGESEKSEYSGDVPLPRGSYNKEKSQDHLRDDPVPSLSSDACHTEGPHGVQSADRTVEQTMKDGSSGHVSSPSLSKAVNESLSKSEPVLFRSEGSSSTEAPSPVGSRQGALHGLTNVPELESNNIVQMQKIGRSEKLGMVEISDPSEDHSSSAIDAQLNALGSIAEANIEKHADATDKDLCFKDSFLDDAGTVTSEGKSWKNDGASVKHCTSRASLVSKNEECIEDVAQDDPDNEQNTENPNDSGTFSPKLEDDEETDEADEQFSDQSEDDLVRNFGFSKSERDSKGSDVFDKKSDSELDYGMVDPLELARQVAIEVEREVEDCREQSCSSSEKVLGGIVRQPGSPDSVSGKQLQTAEGSHKEVTTGKDLATKPSPIREKSALSARNLAVLPTNGTQEMLSSQVTESATAEKGFDLNLEICLEDIDRQGDSMSTPISIVSASRAAAAPSLPVAPLQFEGTLGWKGSAATSAFRPASPRRVTEGEKAVSTEGSSSSKQRHGCLDIDLNIGESVDDRTADLTGTQVPVSSGLHSGESSVEASSRRSERLDLDLNRVTEDGEIPSDWRTEGVHFHQRISHCAQSPSSCSSSKQPSLRNIDLNDQPSFPVDSIDHQYRNKPSQNLSAFGGEKAEDSVISIMGMRVELNRKEFVPQTLNLPNGRTSEPAVDVSVARPGSLLGIGSPIPYAHAPVYGYNGLTSGAAMPFSSTAMYGPAGPISYMFDSRGAPVVPQIVGSAAALPPAFSQPYLISMTGAPGPNGAGPSRNSIDLNAGLILDGGNRDTGNFRQFLNPGHGRSMDEHLKSNAQPSTSSIVGGKRKEPDSPWEPYIVKHHSTPWK